MPTAASSTQSSSASSLTPLPSSLLLSSDGDRPDLKSAIVSFVAVVELVAVVLQDHRIQPKVTKCVSLSLAHQIKEYIQ